MNLCERGNMYALSTNLITARSSPWVLPRSTHNEFSFLFWLKYPFKISSSTFAVKLIPIIFFPIIYTCPLCSSLMCKSDCIICLFISVSIVSLAHSFLISCKCSVLLPVVFLSYKYPSSPTFVAAALILFNILSHFCHHSYEELRGWWIWLAIALL